MKKLADYARVWHTLTLMSAKCLIIIFGSFLDIRENAQWPRFGPPCVLTYRRTT